jgi:endo-1,4-beta-xylanase
MKVLVSFRTFMSALFISGLLINFPVWAQKTLKEAYKDYFPIGVAVSARSLTGPDAELIVGQFNSVTAENAMKIGPIHPEPNRYAWEGPDAIVAFAEKHGMKVRGHTLCWHSQTPRLVFC